MELSIIVYMYNKNCELKYSCACKRTRAHASAHTHTQTRVHTHAYTLFNRTLTRVGETVLVLLFCHNWRSEVTEYVTRHQVPDDHLSIITGGGQ